MNALRVLLAKLWPKRLMGQTIMLLIIALFSAQIAAALIIRSETQSYFEGAETRFMAVRIAPLAALLRDMPVEQQDKIAQALVSRRLQVWVSDQPAISKPTDGDERGDAKRARELAQRIAAELDDLRPDQIRVYRQHDEDDDAPHKMKSRVQGVPAATGAPRQFDHGSTVVAIALGPDRWMNAALQSRPPLRLIRTDGWITFIVTAIAISVIVAFALRRITRPLGQLSAAAGRLGRGETVSPLKEDGPADVRETIRAFNEMQERLHKFVADRTQMLAAISHDLRTPITSLRLRAEMLDDDEARERMIATLSDMQHMVEATLAFAREEASSEPTRATELAALIEAVGDDLGAIGHAITVNAPAKLVYPCRPSALRRALTNLIENAATYGKHATVTLKNTPSGPQIIIEDEGPGIPANDFERIFEPFVRLDTSRNADTGGIGLGMAIARDIVRRHGGDISLANREEGGLSVTITLPAVQA
ncbi:MAG: ATP-binding protein [Rhodospirillales bacterium]